VVDVLVGKTLRAAEAIEAVTGLPAWLKWPNDVLLGAGETWRKAGGLLLDAALDANGGLETAILGIGLNVNIPAGALPAAVTPATSLLVELGRPVARRALLVELLARLERHYEAADAGQSPAGAWAARLVTLGRAVDAGLFDVLWIEGCPLLAPLRLDPRVRGLRKIVADRATAVHNALR